MVKFTKYFFLLIILICTVFVYGKPAKDSLKIQKETENYHIIDNVDSLLNMWYVKNALKSQLNIKQTFSEEADNNLPDSVYIERIKNMNSIMGFSYNEIVKNFIDIYAQRRKNQVGVLLGLSEYYFPIFEKVLDEYNLPLELKYLPIIESALNPRAVSRAGATGLWQFMYTTGKLVDLRISSFVDERRDPVRSTEAAAKYLKQLYGIYGDWMLAIAAYNCGPGNVNKAIKRSNGKMNYWDIYYYLPKETRGYVPAFIAANYVMTYYNEHHIKPQPIQIFQTDTMAVTDYLHLEQVSNVLGLDINLLRDLNPQYKKDIIPGKNELWSLCIPSGSVNKYIELKDSIFKYNDSIYFNPKKIFYKPSDIKSSESNALLAKVQYTVKPNDNIKQIAEWFNVDQTDIRQWNRIKKNKITNGQKLFVYVPKGKVNDYKKLNSMSLQAKNLFAMNNVNTSNKLTAFKKKDANNTKNSIASVEKKDKDLEELGKVLGKLDSPHSIDSLNIAVTLNDTLQQIKINIDPATNNEIATIEADHDFFLYEVKAGDTIWSIARSFSEVTHDLMKRNNIKETDDILPGQKIKIKKRIKN